MREDDAEVKLVYVLKLSKGLLGFELEILDLNKADVILYWYQ